MAKAAARAQAKAGGEHRLRSENLAFDIDVWYPPLSDHTFRSAFLPLRRSDASAIVAYYDAAWRSLPERLTPEAAEALLELEGRIDAALGREFGGGGAFLRLCGRSPKDGEPTDPDLRARIWKDYRKKLEEMAEEEGLPTDDENLRAAAIARTKPWLVVRSGADAMTFLLTSERVFSDMLDWLNYGEPEQVVLREFDDSFDLSTEFRCFIENGVLMGMSQYDTYAKHGYLQEESKRNAVIKCVVSKWKEIREFVETMDGSYCADFGVDLEGGKARFIEISPFRKCTGPALFAWKGDSELVMPERLDVLDVRLCDIILAGREDERVASSALFRIRSMPIEGIGGLVEMNWDMRWSSERVDTPKPYRQLYARVKQDPVTRMIRTLSRIPQQWFGKQHVLFVYGTLKRDCHWHAKYMTGAEFLGESVTMEPQSLVIGQCGVPYLINLKDDEEAVLVRGELWKVSDEILRGIDEYEGIDKGHYSRKLIRVVCDGQCSGISTAFCYFYALKPGSSDVDASLLKAPRIAEYTASQQKECYKPIHHIQVKQLQYLGEDATT